jgi:ribosomal protein S18 acetylase RimI-like enzyme
LIAFREATEGDLPDVVAMLADDVLGGGREDPGPPLPQAYVDGFRAMTARGGVIVLAVLDGRTVGCLQLDILPGVSQLGMVRAQVEGVRVASAHRGGGVGALLLGEAVRRARVAGATSMQLTTSLSRVGAQRFYERLGFVRSHAGFKLAL